jgi:hypothetical protein
VDLYIRSAIRLHGVVLNSLRTGTTLPFYALFPLSLAVFETKKKETKRCYAMWIFPTLLFVYLSTKNRVGPSPGSVSCGLVSTEH